MTVFRCRSEVSDVSQLYAMTSLTRGTNGRRFWREKSVSCCLLAITLCCGMCTVASELISFPGQKLQLLDDVIFRSLGVNIDGSLPVVLWHGMGDSCCSSYSIGGVSEFISDQLGAHPPSTRTHERMRMIYCSCHRFITIVYA